MATLTATKPGMRDRFVYTPGDGRRYRWTAKDGAIVVERIDTVAEVLVMTDTGDRIPVPLVRTATALMAAVDEWRVMGQLQVKADQYRAGYRETPMRSTTPV